ncbi:MAG: HEAT repeat domain-containing protein [Candidatus Thermoplasmatota archaeon]|nr:HEAT repeat domain-containing protein [Candidatus Thermoplasmatota archaeon]
MTRDYVARDPRTGKRISTGKRAKHVQKAAFSAPEGPWKSLLPEQIRDLLDRKVSSVEVSYMDERQLLDRFDAIRGMPSLPRKDDEYVHRMVLDGLCSRSAEERIACLDVFLVISLRETDEMMEMLDVMVDDPEPRVRTHARKVLIDTAPIFPSALRDTIARLVRSEERSARNDGFNALNQAARQWPEVGVHHLDELIREDEVDLRRRSARVLKSIAQRAGGAGWDLIGWTLDDEDSEVRRIASRTLPMLAESAPNIAQIMIEETLFDEDDEVRQNSLKALGRMDKDDSRTRTLILDGCRHNDAKIRMSCVKMLPIILGEVERRQTALELLMDETDSSIRNRLENMARDLAIEGTESERNRFLAPLPKVEMEDGTEHTPITEPKSKPNDRDKNSPSQND